MRHWKQLWWIVPLGLLAIAYQMNQETLYKNAARQKARTAGAPSCRHLKSWLVQPGKYFVCRDEYALNLNPKTKMADWVAYCSDRSSISGSGEQSRDWEPDPAFPEYAQMEPEDYRRIGVAKYDRGHQAPLASFRGMNWRVTNYTTNITPQSAELNRGAWVQLEKYERSLVAKHGDACIITGPYFVKGEERKNILPEADETYTTPSGYWKIIFYQNNVESYIYDQLTPSGVDFKLGRVCNDEVERFTGFLISDRTDDFKYCPN